MNKAAEWWTAEDGGVFCSNCGLFFDDFYEPAPDQCKRCGSIMSENFNTMVWRDYHLSLDKNKYAQETEYPEWLLKFRNEYKDNKCQCIYCKKVITDDKIFRMKDNPQKGICFRCY